MKNVSRYTKKNKILIVVSVIVLLTVIIALSLYYGLKKSPSPNPTVSPTSNSTKKKYFKFHGKLHKNKTVSFDISKYEKSNVFELTISNLKSSMTPPGNVIKDFELIRFISEKRTGGSVFDELIISEVTRGLEVSTNIEFYKNSNIYEHKQYSLYKDEPSLPLGNLKIKITLFKYKSDTIRILYSVSELKPNERYNFGLFDKFIDLTGKKYIDLFDNIKYIKINNNNYAPENNKFDERYNTTNNTVYTIINRRTYD